MPAPVFHDPKHHIKIYQGDCIEILAAIPEARLMRSGRFCGATVDLVFADPPYFLSNGGITCQAGRMVSVNKGEWDRSRGPVANHDFNLQWLAACQRVGVGGARGAHLRLSLMASSLSTFRINMRAALESCGLTGPPKSSKLSKSTISTQTPLGTDFSTTSATPPRTVIKIVFIFFSLVTKEQLTARHVPAPAPRS